MNRFIGFIGAKRSGKDECVRGLVDGLDYERTSFGDEIKTFFDPLVRQHLGFSAFTEIDAEKDLIRPLLEHGGETFEVPLMTKYREKLGGSPKSWTNPRVMAERHLWRELGGVIYEVVRPGFGYASRWEEEYIKQMKAEGFVDGVIYNVGSLGDLRDALFARLRDDRVL